MLLPPYEEPEPIPEEDLEDLIDQYDNENIPDLTGGDEQDDTNEAIENEDEETLPYDSNNRS